MAKYVAFLRGVNVGGRIIKMADLKSAFEAMGFTDVKTILQSGNVVFEGEIDEISRARQKIETALTDAFKYPAIAFIYQLETIDKIVRAYPFDAQEADFQHYVVLLEAGVAGPLVQEAVVGSGEQIKRDKDVIYWKVKKGTSITSPFSKYLAKARYKDFNTVRNINTMKKCISPS